MGGRRPSAKAKAKAADASVNGGAAAKRQQQKKGPAAYQAIVDHGGIASGSTEEAKVKIEPGARGVCIRDIFAKQVATTSWQARLHVMIRRLLQLPRTRRQTRLIIMSRWLLQLVIRWFLQLRLLVIGRLIVAMGTTHWKGYGRRLHCIMVHWATRMAARWQMVPVEILAMGLVLPDLPA